MTELEMAQAEEKARDLFIRTADRNDDVSFPAINEIAKAYEVTIQQGVLYGDILSGIYKQQKFLPNQAIEFYLDLLTPGTEKEYVAYTVPMYGRIPERHIEASVVTYSTYEIANSIDWTLKQARDGRLDVLGRCLEILRAGFVKKLNDDGFHALLAGGVERNVVVYDSAAAAGAFTKRLISLMQQVMRRSSGGNSTSINRGRLTDLFMSPEALEDVRNWSTADIDEVTRREIFVNPDGTLNRIFGVTLHDIDELGDGQQYQEYFLNELGGTLASGDVELVLGLDMTGGVGAQGTLIQPIKSPLEIFRDEHMHRSRRDGLYSWMETGFFVANVKKILLGSL